MGGGKNTNPVVIPEYLYLDRYMEAEEGSPVFQARKRGWDIKNQLKDLEHPPDFGYSEAMSTPSAAALDVFTKARGSNFGAPAIEKGEEEDYDMIDPSIKSVLDRYGKPLRVEPTSDATTCEPGETVTNDGDEHMWESVGPAEVLDVTIDEHKKRLHQEIESLFSAMQTHKYCLHAVICHAGQTAKSGHYWVWIFDFQQNIWRKYNDRTVTENADTKAVIQELSTKGEPYYLMYVRDQDKHDLVNTPRRQPATNTPADTEMADNDTQPTSDHLEYARAAA